MTLPNLKRKRGSGTYGEVYETEQNEIVKCLKIQQHPLFEDNTLVEQTSIKEACFGRIFCNSHIVQHMYRTLVRQHSHKKILIHMENNHISTLDVWNNNVSELERCQKLPHIVYQLLSVLAYLEINYLVHGDLKPTNVLYNPSTQEIQVIDWGSVSFDYRLCKKRTYHEETCTKGYVSPESYRVKCVKEFCVKKPMYGIPKTVYPTHCRKHSQANEVIIPYKQEMNICPANDVYAVGKIIKYLLNPTELNDDSIIDDLNTQRDQSILTMPDSLSEYGDVFRSLLTVDYLKRPKASVLVCDRVFKKYVVKGKEIVSTHKILSNLSMTIGKMTYTEEFVIKQPNLTLDIREILIAWLNEVLSETNRLEVYVLTVLLLDKYVLLTTKQYTDKNYQLLGITMLMLAGIIRGYEHTLEWCNEITNNTYSNQLLWEESYDILETLDFQLYLPTFDTEIINPDYTQIFILTLDPEISRETQNELLERYTKLTNKKKTARKNE